MLLYNSQFVVGNSETRFCVLSSPAAILSREYSASAVAMDGNQPMTIQ